MTKREPRRAQAVVDGRLARTVRTRDRIVDAMLAYVLEGRTDASLAEIAERAGVTQRTLFNHFRDISDAVAAALARSRELSDLLLPKPETQLPPVQRVRAWFAAAGPFYDHYSAARWASLTATRSIAGFDPRQGKGHVLGRLNAAVLELCDAVDPSLRNDPARKAALFVMTDAMAWRLLRVQQELSAKHAADAMAAGVLALCSVSTSGSRKPRRS